MKHFSGPPLKGRLLVLLINIRLGSKSLLGKSTLTYYEKSKITDAKSFITFALGVKILTKPFFYITDDKLERFSLGKPFQPRVDHIKPFWGKFTDSF